MPSRALAASRSAPSAPVRSRRSAACALAAVCAVCAAAISSRTRASSFSRRSRSSSLFCGFRVAPLELRAPSSRELRDRFAQGRRRDARRRKVGLRALDLFVQRRGLRAQADELRFRARLPLARRVTLSDARRARGPERLAAPARPRRVAAACRPALRAGLPPETAATESSVRVRTGRR